MFLKLFSKSKPQAPDDLELLRQYRETANLDFIGILFERYTEMVYLVCYKYLQDEDESKDAAMQIFEDLTNSLLKHEVTNFKSWLHVTAKNYCLMQLRSRKSKEKSKKELFLEDTAMQKEALLHQEAGASQEEELMALEKGLNEIPEEQRRCIQLFYLEQKSYKEVAELTGLDLNKVRSHIQNGRRNLKIYLEKQHEAE